MVGVTAKACFAVWFLFAVRNPLADAFSTTSNVNNNALTHIQQDNAINAITDAITVSRLQINNTVIYRSLKCFKFYKI
jgi:hypothetical protein